MKRERALTFSPPFQGEGEGVGMGFSGTGSPLIQPQPIPTPALPLKGREQTGPTDIVFEGRVTPARGARGGQRFALARRASSESPASPGPRRPLVRPLGAGEAARQGTVGAAFHE